MTPQLRDWLLVSPQRRAVTGANARGFYVRLEAGSLEIYCEGPEPEENERDAVAEWGRWQQQREAS
jgi:hypothetical protein